MPHKLTVTGPSTGRSDVNLLLAAVAVAALIVDLSDAMLNASTSAGDPRAVREVKCVGPGCSVHRQQVAPL